ncbi:MAG: polyamine aminopropyltransferase [Thermovirgaceae bacterium]|nr:polyamine aminopropyltransferase [Thermovirgaceae bacterium]
MEKRTTDLWFTEYQTPNLRLGLRITSILANRRTPYQHLLVADTEQYGRVMALDGAIQVTEKDEFTYHEMLSHIALAAHPNPRKVLVVGGGDGGTAREASRHSSVEEVNLVDIDQQVIDASREFFPALSAGLDNPRVKVFAMDALQFIRERRNEFDVVLVDSTDPVDFAEGLFLEPFYRDVFNSLTDDGFIVAQTESPFAEPAILSSAVSEMRKVFPLVKVYWGAMPTYPTGMWTYAIGSKRHDPVDIRSEIPVGTRYYSKDMHRASFVLPPFLEEIINERHSRK